MLTGRHPELPSKLLAGYPNSPTHIQLHIPDQSNKNWFKPGIEIPLYIDQTPIWQETFLRNKVDLASIPLKFPSCAIVPCIQDFAPYKQRILVPGVDVVVIGFPFGRNETNPFPIWKRAMIASEPAYTIDGKPYAFLDSPGRPGMSGSPVYAISMGFEVTASEKAALDNDVDSSDKLDILTSIGDRLNFPVPTLEFVGVYSGSYGDERFDRLNLGRFWPAGLLHGLEVKPVPGQNPYPPQ